MRLFSIIKKFLNKRKTKLLSEESTIVSEESIDAQAQRQDFVNKIKEESIEDELELNEYNKKISYILDEFKNLFKNMLLQKGCKELQNCNSFCFLAIETRKYYPQLAPRINSVLYYYGKMPGNEEKLDYLMRLYKIIKEG